MSGYILSLISAAMITAIICSFFDEKNGTAGVIRLICGLFLSFVAINPLLNLDFSGLERYLESFSLEAGIISDTGKIMAQEARGDIIKASAQSYIMDKAETLGANITAEVMLDQDNIPLSVELEGNLSPYAKARITGIIADDLGITKEHQIWIG